MIKDKNILASITAYTEGTGLSHLEQMAIKVTMFKTLQQEAKDKFLENKDKWTREKRMSFREDMFQIDEMLEVCEKKHFLLKLAS